MGALRTKMIEEMKLRNFSPRTEQSYVAAMVGLVKYYRRSPDQLTQDEIRSYLLHLQERGLSPSSRNVAISGMKFFYHQILEWDEQKLFLPPRKGSWRLPEVLSQKEVECRSWRVKSFTVTLPKLEGQIFHCDIGALLLVRRRMSKVKTRPLAVSTTCRSWRVNRSWRVKSFTVTLALSYWCFGECQR
jgi:Phage integrase, N-terminal SAM-like domain